MQITHGGRCYTINGINDSDHIVRLLSKTGTFYEIDLLGYIERIKDFLPDGEVVDVGANIGNHTIFLAEFVRTPVTAFEPNPVVLPLLKENLSANDVKVEVVEVGLGSSPRHGRMETVSETNLGMARMDTNSGDIPISTLDEQCRGRQIALIKVDVEGMELEVLHGAVETLKRCRPHLFLEAATKRHLKDLRAFLEPLGYQPIVKWAYTPV